MSSLGAETLPSSRAQSWSWAAVAALPPRVVMTVVQLHFQALTQEGSEQGSLFSFLPMAFPATPTRGRHLFVLLALSPGRYLMVWFWQCLWCAPCFGFCYKWAGGVEWEKSDCMTVGATNTTIHCSHLPLSCSDVVSRSPGFESCLGHILVLVGWIVLPHS